MVIGNLTVLAEDVPLNLSSYIKSSKWARDANRQGSEITTESHVGPFGPIVEW